MRKFDVRVFSAVIKNLDDGVEYAVDIGVVEKGVPFEAYWDSWIDDRIYFTMTAKEINDLNVGDEISEGDILVEIDRNPSIWEAEYDPANYNNQEECF